MQLCKHNWLHIYFIQCGTILDFHAVLDKLKDYDPINGLWIDSYNIIVTADGTFR